jgi:hypothetical protein
MKNKNKKISIDEDEANDTNKYNLTEKEYKDISFKF